MTVIQVVLIPTAGTISINYFSECGLKHWDCQVDNGVWYRGTVSQTLGGIECQKWDDHIPHNTNKIGGTRYTSVFHFWWCYLKNSNC